MTRERDITNTRHGPLLLRLYPRPEGKRKPPYSAPKSFDTPSTSAGARHVDSADLFAAAWALDRRITEHALPDPLREVSVLWPLHGARVDFLWPDVGLVAEADGGQKRWGGGRHNTDEDAARSNMLALAGYTVLRFTVDQLKGDAQQCVDVVKAALALLPRQN